MRPTGELEERAIDHALRLYLREGGQKHPERDVPFPDFAAEEIHAPVALHNDHDRFEGKTG